MEAETPLPVPDDALADILGRLPPCALAASRCVCKSWRAVVDTRGLLLPHALRGIFINYTDYGEPLLLARPSPEFPRISGDLSYVPGFGHSYTHFLDHCNGLLLCYGGYGCCDDDYCVVNPATRRWESFSSPRVNIDGRGDAAAYLVFDPAVSPHYEVFWMPHLPRPEEKAVRPEDVPAATFNLSRLFSSQLDDGTLGAMEGTEEEEVLEELARPPPPPSIEQGFFPTRKLSLLARSRLGNKPYDPYGLMEWPQSPCTLHVFSSRTRCWEERPFVREGEPVGTVKDARWDHFCVSYYSVYWQGTLYVHCHGGFVMRFSLKLGKYRVIKTPEDIEERRAGRCLGRSIGGVYFAKICHHQLRIWILNDELGVGKAEWVLKHRTDLDRSALWAAARRGERDRATPPGPWMLKYSNSFCQTQMHSEGHFEWDSDDDGIVPYEDGDVDEDAQVYILGFHPYKEVVFLMVSFVAVAYHLSTSKVQWLGESNPMYYVTGQGSKGVDEAFPYTPCMIGDLLNSYETYSED